MTYFLSGQSENPAFEVLRDTDISINCIFLVDVLQVDVLFFHHQFNFIALDLFSRKKLFQTNLPPFKIFIKSYHIRLNNPMAFISNIKPNSIIISDLVVGDLRSRIL